MKQSEGMHRMGKEQKLNRKILGTMGNQEKSNENERMKIRRLEVREK